MKQKKILLIYYKLFKPGGVAKVMTNLANELVKQGYEVEILIMTANKETFYAIHKDIKIHSADMFSHWCWKVCEFNVKHLNFIPKIYNINTYISHIGVYLLLKKWLKENHKNYDTIISCWYKLSTLIGLIGGEIAKKTIAWEHIYYGVGGFLYAKKLRAYYKYLKSIVCINKPSIRYYQKFNQTFFISNLIEDDFANLDYQNATLKKNNITFVGRLEIEKNVKELIEIFSKIKNTKDWKLQIIGDGVLRKSIEEQIENLELKNKIVLLGRKSTHEIIEILKASKIFALTSTVEAFGLVLVEAMFCSNTLIAYDCKYGPSDIINEKNGFLIPLHDKEEFQKKLENLIHDENLLNKLIQSSYQESQNWKKDKIIEQWKKII